MATSDINLKRLQKALTALRQARRGSESVRQFAKAAEISPSHIALMEGRKRKADLKKAEESSPTIFMLHRYLHHCGTTLTQFFSEFERETPRGLTATQAELLDTVRILITAGEDAERRVQERVDDVRAWLGTQEEAKVKEGKARKKKAG